MHSSTKIIEYLWMKKCKCNCNFYCWFKHTYARICNNSFKLSENNYNIKCNLSNFFLFINLLTYFSIKMKILQPILIFYAWGISFYVHHKLPISLMFYYMSMSRVRDPVSNFYTCNNKRKIFEVPFLK